MAGLLTDNTEGFAKQGHLLRDVEHWPGARLHFATLQ